MRTPVSSELTTLAWRSFDTASSRPPANCFCALRSTFIRPPWLLVHLGSTSVRGLGGKAAYVVIRDPMEGLAAALQSGQTLTMIDRIATLVGSPVDVLRRSDLVRPRLAAIGVPTDICYSVLRLGARVEFSQRSHFLSLARTLLDEQTLLTVVLPIDDAAVRATIPLSLQNELRFISLDR